MTTPRVALLTAAGSGIGAAAARRLAADGWQVAILSSSGKGEALARELGGLGITGSNRETADLQRLIDAALARWGRIDAVVNSAGHGPKGPLLDITDADWHLGMEPKSGSYPVAGSAAGSSGGPMTGAIRSLM